LPFTLTATEDFFHRQRSRRRRRVGRDRRERAGRLRQGALAERRLLLEQDAEHVVGEGAHLDEDLADAGGGAVGRGLEALLELEGGEDLVLGGEALADREGAELGIGRTGHWNPPQDSPALRFPFRGL
jgi:hypothetical protein